MSRLRAIAPLALVVALGAVGCGTQPIPTVAVEGTTVTLPVPSGFDIGYGLQLASDPSRLGQPNEPIFRENPDLPEDLQRGEMILTLYERNGSLPGALVTRLAVRAVVRAQLDPASAHAGAWTARGRQQRVIVFDLPVGVVGDGQQEDFLIRLDRYRRDPGNDMKFERVAQTYFDSAFGCGPSQCPWFGWGLEDPGSATQLIPIAIVDDPAPEGQEVARYTPLEFWDAGISGYVGTSGIGAERLYEAAPQPEVRLLAAVSPGALPAPACEFDVTIPTAKVNVERVRLLRDDPSGGIVLWNAPPPSADPCGSGDGDPQPLSIKIPDSTTDDAERYYGVAVVFSPANFDCQSPPPERVLPGEISVGPVKAYNLDGVPVPRTFNVVARDLM